MACCDKEHIEIITVMSSREDEFNLLNNELPPEVNFTCCEACLKKREKKKVITSNISVAQSLPFLNKQKQVLYRNYVD